MLIVCCSLFVVLVVCDVVVCVSLCVVCCVLYVVYVCKMLLVFVGVVVWYGLFVVSCRWFLFVVRCVGVCCLLFVCWRCVACCYVCVSCCWLLVVCLLFTVVCRVVVGCVLLVVVCCLLRVVTVMCEVVPWVLLRVASWWLVVLLRVAILVLRAVVGLDCW